MCVENLLELLKLSMLWRVEIIFQPSNGSTTSLVKVIRKNSTHQRNIFKITIEMYNIYDLILIDNKFKIRKNKEKTNPNNVYTLSAYIM
jgi:hypothetical protein